MKNLKKYIVALAALATIWSSCKRDDKINIIEGTPSPYIANLDLRRIYRGSDVTLTKEATREAIYLRGQVISDHSAGNLPQGLLFVQNAKNLGGSVDSLRGIAINIGAAAANYIPGDSIHVNIEGGVLKRVNGILQITGLTAAKIEKKASGVNLRVVQVSTSNLKSNPERFESCLALIYNCNFEPNIGIETVEGVKIFNEGSGDMQMNVSSNANFKNEFLPYSAIIKGLIIPSSSGVQQIYPRFKADFTPTSLTVDPNIPLGPNPVIITGFFADPTSTDANFEYIQLMATQDLDFRQKNFSLITTNNAGASTPTGFPVNGWVTGDLRTYKFNITRGTVAKGTFFYVGGNKVINGNGSTDISNANWVVSKQYANLDGDDGIGTKTSNLLANTGNAGGIAVFATTNVNLNTIPSDVVFYAGGGSLFGDGVGYAICDNDRYKRYNGAVFQPFYGQGTNTTSNKVGANPGVNSFSCLGGVYDATAKKWVGSLRVDKPVLTPKTLADIEGRADVTKVIN
ncbi:DUF5689 domain-containing protein [Pedobacter chitinilyticus]|uniref:DUF5689 domain-containing protein n=1 Tax=Pedobacter chitinilyticus TaxID=2233776 RepID=A0A443Z2D2_9SPHI|nr:DUF5689 domain-containing protein [Pedobacter chitinilyticus]RWU10698.1 hypothetical protein DPV69_05015 [Pedobacter chitinilyticus]